MMFDCLLCSGAREGQMPEVLAMIQTTKLTPAPSVVTITILALAYLMTISDISMLMNYVGFATWLSIGNYQIPYKSGLL